MPDWNRLIFERMGTSTLSREVRDEVVAELATHLEELYQACRAQGANESQAIETALSQAADWQELGREISDAKNEEDGMNDRSKQFWLPGLVTLTASMLWLMLLQRWNWRPETTLAYGSPPLAPYLIWLITQPVFGAAGAYFSCRNGGSRLACRGNVSFHCHVGFADFHSAGGILCGTKSFPVEASRVLCSDRLSLGNLPGPCSVDWGSSILESGNPETNLTPSVIHRTPIHFAIG